MFLVAKKISSVRYMTTEEADAMMWDKRPLVIQFTDGSLLTCQSDDEGNEGGAMYFQNDSGAVLIHTI
jgi:hypothetical protein